MTAKEISEFILNMIEHGATKEELARVIEYSAAVIDCERIYKDLQIEELKQKYQ